MERAFSRLSVDCCSRETIRHFNTGQQISASPIAYRFKSKDYVAIAAGSNVVAFGAFGLPD